MVWYIKKNWTVSSSTPILFSFYRTFLPGASRTITTELIVCDTNNAPTGHDVGPMSKTRVLCKLVTNLNKVPNQLWEERIAHDGRTYHTLTHEIGMQIESGGLKFDLRVDGVVYGDITATFD
jgi:hypothetical protein